MFSGWYWHNTCRITISKQYKQIYITTQFTSLKVFLTIQLTQLRVPLFHWMRSCDFSMISKHCCYLKVKCVILSYEWLYLWSSFFAWLCTWSCRLLVLSARAACLWPSPALSWRPVAVPPYSWLWSPWWNWYRSSVALRKSWWVGFAAYVCFDIPG